ncbi:phosphoribulokinase/uridine kinase [Stachybotrys elegans]|uniref:Phosphoribulokinase/uridine kinase n=1 Tax=Stachybotrys elegans TaxID=80388 RepID=A0A8K0SEJ9_9HYPO|nr:phosphoribulokinase/uridine kinase [Stachybotrys elegans]
MAKDSPDIAGAVSLLTERVKSLLETHVPPHSRGRILIALSGVPGSGKSTISSALLRALPSHGIDNVIVLPMDGFHYTTDELKKFEDPVTAFRRRGAPFTFDSERFLGMLSKLKELPVTTGDEPEFTLLAPSFDHAVKNPVEDSIAISSRTRVVIVEGNYTLLDDDPWRQIANIVDDRWFIDVNPQVALERLVTRHIQAGIETSRDAAVARALENDIPNGDMIRSKLIEPTIRIIN